MFGPRRKTGTPAAVVVSIPESGFCLFGLGRVRPVHVGGVVFQSLSRDSVCLDPLGRYRAGPPPGVSIPESGFCLFGPPQVVPPSTLRNVSIPESGFCLFGRIRNVGQTCCSGRFQSLSRDSVCLDTAVTRVRVICGKFQSLSRDSVCLDLRGVLREQCRADVSIPESGFCLFGHDGTMQQYGYWYRFNP